MYNVSKKFLIILLMPVLMIFGAKVQAQEVEE